MSKIMDQKPGFLNVFFHVNTWVASFTPLTHAHILQDINGYNTDMESSAEILLKS